MNFKDRLYVNSKAVSLKLMIGMSIFYGLIFGGISQIDDMMQGTMDVKNFIISIIVTCITYGMMFLLIILIIYNAQGVKMLMTLGISRKNLVKCWRDYQLYSSFIGVAAISIMWVLIQLREPTFLVYRWLGIDVNNPSVYGFIVYLLMVTALLLALMGALNLIAQVGNCYGWRWVINLVIGMVASLLLVGPAIIKMIIWGHNYGLVLAGIGVVILLTFTLSDYLVKKMEVKG